MEAGEKIGLRYGRKISVGGMITVHIPGLSKFQSIWLWNFNNIWDDLCKLCNTQEVLCVLLALVTWTEKKNVPDVVENQKAEWKTLCLSYEKV